jgi:hypothetical protein
MHSPQSKLILEGWIDTAAEGPMPFIVLGDFNRRFNQPGDRVWAEIDDGEAANADLTAHTQDMPVSCRDNRFTEFIREGPAGYYAIPLRCSHHPWTFQMGAVARSTVKPFWH